MKIVSSIFFKDLKIIIAFVILSSFCSNTLTLYNAICAQGNNRVSHEICKLVDEKQLMYCVKNPCEFCFGIDLIKNIKHD